MDFGGEEWGNPEAHELAEDVAERERVQEAQRRKKARLRVVGPSR